MARGQTLESIIAQVRFEIGRADQPHLNLAEKTRTANHIKRVQDTLYQEHFWPQLSVWAPLVAGIGQRFYDFPVGVNPDRIERIFRNESGRVQPAPLIRGIGVNDYFHTNSMAGERGDPAQRWDIRDNGAGVTQLELWPLPATTNYAYLVLGMRPLAPLVDDNDRADLDGILISLFVAAEVLSREKKEDAQAKAVLATQRRDTLIANAAADSEPIVIGGATPSGRYGPNIPFAPRG